MTPSVHSAQGFIYNVLSKRFPPPWKWIIHLIALSVGRMALARGLLWRGHSRETEDPAVSNTIVSRRKRCVCVFVGLGGRG